MGHHSTDNSKAKSGSAPVNAIHLRKGHLEVQKHLPVAAVDD